MTKRTLLALTLGLAIQSPLFAQLYQFELLQYGKSKKVMAWYDEHTTSPVNLEVVDPESGLSANQGMENMNLELLQGACRVGEVHPLVIVSYFGRRELVEYFLDKAEVRTDTALLSQAFASSIHHNDWGLSKMLLDKGGDVNSTCPLCFNASAIQIALGNACDEAMVEYLWNSSSSEALMNVDCRGFSTAFYAAGNAHLKYLKDLIASSNADLERTARYGVGVLAAAITAGHVDNARYILDSLPQSVIESLDEKAKEHIPGGLLSAAVSSQNREMVSLVQQYIRPVATETQKLEADIDEYLGLNQDWVLGLNEILFSFDEKGIGTLQLPIDVPFPVLQFKTLPTFDQIEFWRAAILEYPDSRALVTEGHTESWDLMEDLFARLKELYFAIESTHLIQTDAMEYPHLDQWVGEKTYHQMLDHVFGIKMDMQELMDDISKQPPYRIWHLSLTEFHTFEENPQYQTVENLYPIYLFHQVEFIPSAQENRWLLANGEPNTSKMVTLPTPPAKHSALQRLIAKDMNIEELPDGLEWVK